MARDFRYQKHAPLLIWNLTRNRVIITPMVTKERTGIIYLYVFPDGTMYVGQTWRSLRKRHTAHLGDNLTVDVCAIQKHKTEPVIIAGGITTQKALDEFERFYIKELGTMSPNGWNETDGGNGCGIKHSAITRAKRARSMREVWKRRGFREAQSERRRQLWTNPEFRKKCKAGQAIAQAKDDYKEKHRVITTARWADANSSLRKSVNKKGKTFSENYRKAHEEKAMSLGYELRNGYKLCDTARGGCGKYLPLADFRKRRKGLFGAQTRCKACRAKKK